MKRFIAMGLVAGTLAVASAGTDQKFATLKVGEDVYRNVTVTSVTDTDIYFTHAGGMGNAKLKNLDPELQKHFGFNAGKAARAEQALKDADIRYRQEVASRKPVVRERTDREPVAPADDSGDIVVPKLHAKSFRGKAAPHLEVDKWLNGAPNLQGKFVLVDFWATWCGPCRQSIPHLNALHAKFGDRVTIVGLTAENEQVVRKMKSPQINYAVAIDPHSRMQKAAGVTGIPHLMLIDPSGIVRFEGMPHYLDERGLERLLNKYSR